ncbi:shikimate dehydrogenase [Methanobrevibacter curvatus]|uniref:Shikimate dehydrogenase (NADP(+)) n=1 Tax=Methanobrevibacter curvatus TaxID=49547 RepID=A0A166ERN2_9EURY|nr:shikimate dehydrogenase [Methanobrevibacter curvatus]KZX16935.1 shikimate dehydrogenase [Methanobrevibacter curvatus]
MFNSKTILMGLIGHPVEHSVSAQMHNAIYKSLGLNYVYLNFDVEKDYLKKAINGAKALNVLGFNVTIPHKTNVLNELDEFDFMANMIGAVNTIHFKDKIAKGYNTDGIGAIKAIKEKTSLKDKKVVILGAGGAARAISFQTAISGISELVILNRSLNKAKSLSYDCERILKENLEELENFKEFKPDIKINYGELDKIEEEIKDGDILINTTSVGLYPNVNQEPLAKAGILHSDLIVNDVIYNPLETRLLKEAKIAGATTISGVKMLIYQGAESFKIWTGIDAPISTMEQAVKDAMDKIMQ